MPEVGAMSTSRRVVYCVPSEPTPTIAQKALDALPANVKRSSKVHSLVRSYSLLAESSTSRSERFRSPQLPSRSPEPPQEVSVENTSATESSGARARVLETGLASRKELEEFHEKSFVAFLLAGDRHPPSLPPSPPSCPDDEDEPATADVSAFGFSASAEYAGEESDTDGERPKKRTKLRRDEDVADFGLEDDCPPFPLLATYVRLVAGASLSAARELREDRADIAIAWDGGRHHAHRALAKGFCYVNDAVLAILEMRRKPQTAGMKKLDRVIYIDIDIHHGDGVEEAFHSTPRVLTLSMHLHAPQHGFFPLSGSLSSSGPGPPSPAASHALNVALLPNLSTPSFLTVFRSAVLPVLEAYDPAAVVMQCGLDGLVGDPSGKGKEGWGWRLDIGGVGKAVEMVCREAEGGEGRRKRKVLLLGGGGYSSVNAARGWAYLTSVALGRPLDLSSAIPQSEPFHDDYGPSFILDVTASEGLAVDENGSLKEGRIREVVEVMRGHAEVLRRRYSKVG